MCCLFGVYLLAKDLFIWIFDHVRYIFWCCQICKYALDITRSIKQRLDYCCRISRILRDAGMLFFRSFI